VLPPESVRHVVMENKSVFVLEWHISDILKKYPELNITQAQRVIDALTGGKYALIQEGWYVIADIVRNILDTK
jgi:hypothetical protein